MSIHKRKNIIFQKPVFWEDKLKKRNPLDAKQVHKKILYIFLQLKKLRRNQVEFVVW